MDREKVIKGLGIVSRILNEMGRRNEMDIVDDALALLKEDCHNCKLECLLQKYDQLKEKYDKLLKDQETENLYKCPNCGTWVSAENVVRCKDCAYAFFKEGLVKHGHIVCTKPYTERWQAIKPNNWFCADGKRK